jgi:ubiquinone biosynthesis protein COQ9
MPEISDKLIDAALMHVPFDGWSEATFTAAIRDTGMDETLARASFPRGAVDLALAFHRRGDLMMVTKLRGEDLSQMRFRDKIVRAVQIRLEVVENDKEAVRRGSTLFTLPVYAPDGAKAIWGTSDQIWTALGDPSDDINWYTKRVTLSGVYSSTVLYWLGDQSADHAATWAFLDRRVDNVMQFERVKKAVRENRMLQPLLAGPNWLLSKIKAPSKLPPTDLPGSWAGRSGPGKEN